MSSLREWEFIPRHAFLYFPQASDLKEGEGKTMLRRIFESGHPYEEYEELKLNELNASIKKKGVTMISWFTEANKLRFLHAKKFDIDDTRKTIVQHCKWRSTTIPITVTPDLQAFLDSGAVYFSGRDHCFLPILVIDIAKFDLNNAECQKVDFLSRVLGVLFEFMIDELFVEGQVENYVMIVNLNEQGVWSIGSLVKNIMSFTTNTYRSRLFAAYIVNSPGTITMLWNGVKGMLSENTVKKISFHSKNVPQPLFNHCGKGVIQKKFGGNHENVKHGFWPPAEMNKRVFHLEPEQEKRLTSVHNYSELFHSGRLGSRKVCKLLIEEVKSHSKLQAPPLHVTEPPYVIKRQEGSARESNTLMPSSEDLRTAQFHEDVTSEIKKDYSFMEEQLSVIPTHKPSQFRPSERPQPSTLTVGSAIVLPLDSQIQNLTGNSDSGDHASGVSYVKQTAIRQVSIVRDLDLPADHELHINQVRIIRTFFDSSHYKNMKKNYYDFI